MALSIKAANRLCAFSMAAKSPVKCKLISSMGCTCACPPQLHHLSCQKQDLN
jgi:hypothetical protein